jgi:hypothetical protein
VQLNPPLSLSCLVDLMTLANDVFDSLHQGWTHSGAVPIVI